VSQQFGANQTDVFVVDRNGQLNVFWVVGEGAWNGPLKIGPAGIAPVVFYPPPIAVSQQFGANQTDVFLIDQNGQLNVFWVVGEGAWNGPLPIGPVGLAVPGSPIAVSQQFGTNQTDVFVIDQNGQLNVFWVVGEGAWNGPLQIGPTGIAAPGISVTVSQQFGANQTDVFVVDPNGQLNVFWVVGEGAWGGPLKLGPTNLTTPSRIAVSQQFGANQTDVFAVDQNGQVNVFWVLGEGAWGGPKILG
jgi:3-deoxy-D-manno-octulosonic-acid transferase